ncbi:MAG: hypothetical protein UX89_C0002G0073 [Parcubacteria group bacterium GW2011_GWA2_47_16]|nr:MAG: hypothetical protein UX89_C0002G0073 [Parcubacteria group bacterium GW2011_GWA2_47_16]
MNSPVLGKLYTLLEHASIGNERKIALQKALAKLLVEQQIRLLYALSDEGALEIFVKNFSAKLELHGGDEKALVESELAALRKASELV